MPKVSNKSATKTDKIVGQNIRVHRLSKGLTQEGLGDRLGVTFQQIQKYEKGSNRIGSGRLYEIAEVLEVPVTSFFEGEQKPKASGGLSPFDLLKDPLLLKMVREFSKIHDVETRRAVLAVVETLVLTRR